MQNNPYVGPRPYERDDRRNFYGRQREARDLTALIMAERVVLFYAPSGAGKTSLLNTQIIPALEEEGFNLLPAVRVGSDLPPQIDPQDVDNVFVFNALVGLAKSPNASLKPLGSHTLLSFLRQIKLDEGKKSLSYRPPIIIFDQFEELFTTHRTRWQEARGFFEQVREALGGMPTLGVVFTMREDHVAEMDPYAPLLPGRLHARFRMERLERAGALEAVRKPAQNAGCPFDPGVAERLVDDLRRIRRVGESASQRDEDKFLGPYVEPVQLQVVCNRLWESLPAQEDARIQWEEVEAFGNVDRALTDFYEEALAHCVRETGVSERQVRRWFGERLITPMETRGLALRGEAETAGLPNEAVDILEERHLIRAERRAGARWYELSHDRLVTPVLKSNLSWRMSYRNPLAATTRAWLEAGRAPQKLLKGAQLDEAQAYTSENPSEVIAEEREFLAESVRQRELERETADRTARRRRNIAIATAGVMLMLISLTIWSLANARRATASRLNAQAMTALVEEDYHLAALLALEANKLNDEEGLDVLGQVPYHSEYVPTNVLEGHLGFVTSVAWHPDDHTLASGSWDQSIIVWDVEQGEAAATLEGHTNWVLSVAWHPDEHILASGSWDQSVIIWDVEREEALVTLEGHTEPVHSVAWHPDGRLLASGGDDQQIIIWDVEREEALATLGGHSAPVHSVAWSPDGRLLASGGEDNSIIIWDVEREEALVKLEGHTDWVNSVAWSPDGRRIVSGGEDKQIIIWDVEREEALIVKEGHADSVCAVAWHPDGRTIASSGKDGRIIIWEAERGEALINLAGDTGVVDSLAWRPDGHVLATGSRASRVILWELERHESAVALEGHADSVYDVAWSPDGRALASGDEDGYIIIWDVERGEAKLTLQGHTGWINSLAWHPGGRTLASGGGCIIIWDAEQGTTVARLEGHTAWVKSVAWRPDGGALASASQDGTAVIWDVESGEALATLRGHPTWVESVAWSPDGQILASGDEDGNIIIWDAERGEAIANLQGHKSCVGSLAWHPEGGRLASGSYDGNVIVWDVERARAIAKLEQHIDWVNGVAWHPDGHLLASGGSDGHVIIWDVEREEAVTTLMPHTYGVNSIAWRPDGHLLASGGMEELVRLTPEIYIGEPCRWLVHNLGTVNWGYYRGWTLYRPTCENLPRPEILGPAEAVAHLSTGDISPLMDALLLTLKGRVLLVGGAASLLGLVVLVLWACFLIIKRRNATQKRVAPEVSRGIT